VQENMEAMRIHKIGQISLGLCKAATEKHDMLAYYIVSKNPELESIFLRELCYRACRKGDISWIQDHIQQITLSGIEIVSCLKYALKLGYDDIFMLIVENTAKLGDTTLEIYTSWMFDICRLAAERGNLGILRYIIEETPNFGYPTINCLFWWKSKKWKSYGVTVEVTVEAVRKYLTTIHRIQKIVGIEEAFQQVLAIGVDTYIAGIKAKKKSPAALSVRPRIKF
jgi:hypothetical protein